MSNLEIKEKILYNNNRIKELFNPNMFVLNEEICELQKENEEFRKKCTHEFKNGECIYCFVKEKEE